MTRIAERSKIDDLYRIFSKRENILSLIAIVISLVLVILNIFTGYISNEVLLGAILFVLGLLATNQIIERESKEGETGKRIDELCQRVQCINQDFLLPRQQIEPFEEFISEAEEMFYAGGHANGLVVPHSTMFEKWLRDGKSLKFIVQDPNNEGLLHLDMPCILYNPEAYKNQILVTLRRLTDLKELVHGAKLDVRLCKVVPTQSITILDGHQGGKKLCALLHLPEGDASTAPFFILSKEKDKEWFHLFYERYYKNLWEKAEPYWG